MLVTAAGIDGVWGKCNKGFTALQHWGQRRDFMNERVRVLQLKMFHWSESQKWTLETVGAGSLLVLFSGRWTQESRRLTLYLLAFSSKLCLQIHCSCQQRKLWIFASFFLKSIFTFEKKLTQSLNHLYCPRPRPLEDTPLSHSASPHFYYFLTSKLFNIVIIFWIQKTLNETLNF